MKRLNRLRGPSNSGIVSAQSIEDRLVPVRVCISIRFEVFSFCSFLLVMKTDSPQRRCSLSTWKSSSSASSTNTLCLLPFVRNSIWYTRLASRAALLGIASLESDGLPWILVMDSILGLPQHWRGLCFVATKLFFKIGHD